MFFRYLLPCGTARVKLWSFSVCAWSSPGPHHPACLPFQHGAHCWNSLLFSHSANVLTLFTEKVLWPIRLVWDFFFFFNFWLRWVFAACRLSLIAMSGSYSLVLVPGLLIAEHRLSSMAHRLSCPKACGILPDQGLNPCPQHQQADS